MLDGRDDDVAALGLLAEGQALDGEVVGLGAAGREIDLVAARADQGGDVAAGGLDGLLGFAAGRVQAAGIPEGLLEVRPHRFPDLGEERGRRDVIEIDFPHGVFRSGRRPAGRTDGPGLRRPRPT